MRVPFINLQRRLRLLETSGIQHHPRVKYNSLKGIRINYCPNHIGDFSPILAGLGLVSSKSLRPQIVLSFDSSEFDDQDLRIHSSGPVCSHCFVVELVGLHEGRYSGGTMGSSGLLQFCHSARTLSPTSLDQAPVLCPPLAMFMSVLGQNMQTISPEAASGFALS